MEKNSSFGGNLEELPLFDPEQNAAIEQNEERKRREGVKAVLEDLEEKREENAKIGKGDMAQRSHNHGKHYVDRDKKRKEEAKRITKESEMYNAW